MPQSILGQQISFTWLGHLPGHLLSMLPSIDVAQKFTCVTCLLTCLPDCLCHLPQCLPAWLTSSASPVYASDVTCIQSVSSEFNTNTISHLMSTLTWIYQISLQIVMDYTYDPIYLIRDIEIWKAIPSVASQCTGMGLQIVINM